MKHSKGICFFSFLISLQLILGLVSYAGSVSYAKTTTLAERFEQEIEHPSSGFSADSELPKNFLEILTQKHIVFVDGVMNELANIAGNYYTDNIAQVKRLGISYDHLRFPSTVSIPKNAEQLAAKIFKIHRRVKKPIILIGHSMGGAEVTYMALKYPQLLLADFYGKPIIEKVIAIEPAIGGSILAENLSFLGRNILQEILGEGLSSLRRDISRASFKDVYQNLLNYLKTEFSYLGDTKPYEKLSELSQKVFFVRGSHHPRSQNLSWGLNAVLFFCQSGLMDDVENDGLLNVEDQILGLFPTFGVDLGILEADHIELVVSGLVSHSNKAHRKAFTRALLQTVYQNPASLMQLSPQRKFWDFEIKKGD
jgi:hypothetical protein